MILTDQIFYGKQSDILKIITKVRLTPEQIEKLEYFVSSKFGNKVKYIGIGNSTFPTLLRQKEDGIRTIILFPDFKGTNVSMNYALHKGDAECGHYFIPDKERPALVKSRKVLL